MQPLWRPSADRVAQSQLARFAAEVRQHTGRPMSSYEELHAWSLEDPAAFWAAVWDFCDVVTTTPASRTCSVPLTMDQPRPPGTRWFEGARLNFAQNLLRHTGTEVALVEVDEAGTVRETSYAELHRQVARFQSFLVAQGVTAGDRVAGFLPNRAEAVVAMLATTGLGAVWSSCSPDFGFQGVVDRFGQIEPRVLVACNGYQYGGKRFSTVERVAEVARAVPSIGAVVVVQVLDAAHDAAWTSWSDACAHGPDHPTFVALPPDHPVYILYSSGTTGVPKCIVHGAAGTLVQHAKELVLHTDVRASDTLFYFTTCGWMMWNWLVSGLMTGCRVVLYDGSPGHPDLEVLWRMAAEQGVTHFGTSPKFLATVRKRGLVPGASHDLRTIRTVLSTGAPLSAELFEWVYACVGDDLQLASISGGTDIVSCFMLGSPLDPVYAGQIQRPGLGMAIEAWSEPNRPVVGSKGELVCVRPFPSMPVAFYGDDDGARYRAAYFEMYPGVWRHGDYVEVTEQGGIIVHGRSDATLNPGGVRIGTAELYRVVENHPSVVDSIVVGLPAAGDVEIVLFVVLAHDATLSADLAAELRASVRAECTPRHVPARIMACPEVPRTISGKKVEIAVNRVLRGQSAPNRDALANPEALDFFASVRGTIAQRAR